MKDSIAEVTIHNVGAGVQVLLVWSGGRAESLFYIPAARVGRRTIVGIKAPDNRTEADRRITEVESKVSVSQVSVSP